MNTLYYIWGGGDGPKWSSVCEQDHTIAVKREQQRFRKGSVWWNHQVLRGFGDLTVARELRHQRQLRPEQVIWEERGYWSKVGKGRFCELFSSKGSCRTVGKVMVFCLFVFINKAVLIVFVGRREEVSQERVGNFRKKKLFHGRSS